MNTTATPTAALPFTVTVTISMPPPGASLESTAASPALMTNVTAPATPPVVAPTSPATVPPATPAAPPATTAPNAASAPMPAAPEAAAPLPASSALRKWLLPAVIVVVLIVVGLLAWQMLRPKGLGEGFVSSNGRLEATEIDVSAKLGGRVQDILVSEGDFVSKGQTLAHMQVQTLDAQRDEARARQQQSVAAVASAEAQVAVREADRQAALAAVVQRESEFIAATRRFARSQTLAKEGASSEQELDDDRARMRSAQAAVAATKAQVDATQAAIVAARTQVAGARAAVTAVEATVTRVKADIDDSALTAPRDGRVQYRIAEPGEVLAGGGKVLNLVDIGDVYMTFFVPETAAGKLALGSDVRIVLDAAPQYVIPGKVTFVASNAQFTPKTVETANERQKLMFRVKAQIDPVLLKKHFKLVKTGLPGMAWIKLDGQAAWPPKLEVKVPQ